jgi:hypothetical protein
MGLLRGFKHRLAGLKELTLASDNGSPTSSMSASRPEVRPSLTAARVVLTASGSKPTRAAAATSQVRLSALDPSQQIQALPDGSVHAVLLIVSAFDDGGSVHFHQHNRGDQCGGVGGR